ncbi:Hypothetical protein FKW44_013845 [Caligus rogercresseyi]|uniref:CCHC-type domain-containing protein n=1 Tax=Caligus rogercresseyi TaxID=217165 RepID=A0A7T8GY61_CALRO|nr:Hypothetical protein FKW44_013845 [Caligus rogercresseyi]
MSKLEIEEYIFAKIRGLDNLRKAQKPIEVIVKNEILSIFGEIKGEFQNVPFSKTSKKEEDREFLEFFNNFQTGKISIRIKPNRKLPVVIPLKGRKVELQAEMQQTQCFKCLKFGHVQAKCSAQKKIKYLEFEKYFRQVVGLSERIEGAEERKLAEEAARQEEQEEERTETLDLTDENETEVEIEESVNLNHGEEETGEEKEKESVCV